MSAAMMIIIQLGSTCLIAKKRIGMFRAFRSRMSEIEMKEINEKENSRMNESAVDPPAAIEASDRLSMIY